MKQEVHSNKHSYYWEEQNADVFFSATCRVCTGDIFFLSPLPVIWLMHFMETTHLFKIKRNSALEVMWKTIWSHRHTCLSAVLINKTESRQDSVLADLSLWSCPGPLWKEQQLWRRVFCEKKMYCSIIKFL